MRRFLVRGVCPLLVVGVALYFLGTYPRPIDDEALQVAVEKIILKCSGERVIGRFKGWGPDSRLVEAAIRLPRWLWWCLLSGWGDDSVGANTLVIRRKPVVVVILPKDLPTGLHPPDTPRLRLSHDRDSLERVIQAGTNGPLAVVSIEGIERASRSCVVHCGCGYGGFNGQGIDITARRTWLGYRFDCVGTWMSDS